MKYFAYPVLLLGVLFLLPACDPQDDPTPPAPTGIDINCIRLFDENGLGLGLYGNCTDDRDFTDFALSAEEKAFLNFTDTVSLAGTETVDIQLFAVFPNPVVIDHALMVRPIGGDADQFFKLKMAIVDSNAVIINQYSLKISGTQGVALMIDDDKYNLGESYRMFYQLSSQAGGVFFEGYGDILVCKKQIQTGIDQDCF